MEPQGEQVQREAASFSLLDGKLRLYKRPESPNWQCAAYFGSKNWRTSTRETDFARAKDVAEDWYITLRAKLAAGLVRPLRRFQDAA